MGIATGHFRGPRNDERGRGIKRRMEGLAMTRERGLAMIIKVKPYSDNEEIVFTKI